MIARRKRTQICIVLLECMWGPHWIELRVSKISISWSLVKMSTLSYQTTQFSKWKIRVFELYVHRQGAFREQHSKCCPWRALRFLTRGRIIWTKEAPKSRPALLGTFQTLSQEKELHNMLNPCWARVWVKIKHHASKYSKCFFDVSPPKTCQDQQLGLYQVQG